MNGGHLLLGIAHE